MSVYNCEKSRVCSVFAIVVSVVIGIVAAIFQGTSVIATVPYYLLGSVVVALVYLAVLVLSVSIKSNIGTCAKTPLSLLLLGTLGTVLSSGVLLAALSPASVLGAIVVGIQVFFVSLMLISVGCYIKCIVGE